MTTLKPISETKKLISDNIVRHCLIEMSAKASVILSHFAHNQTIRELDHNLTYNPIYFAGDSFTKTPPQKWNKISPKIDKHEIIGLLPKILLSAYITPNGIHTIQSERTIQGQYTQTIKSSSAANYFVDLKSIDHKITHRNNMQSLQFTGGLAGFIGYDLAAYQQINQSNNHDHDKQTEQLVAAMGDYDIYLKEEEDGWAIYGPDDLELMPLYQHLTQALQIIAAQELSNHSTQPPSFQVVNPFTPVWSFDEYNHAFQRIQQYLRAGDCYQVNLTQPFTAQVEGELLATLDDLLQLTQAPYSGYMKVGEHEILSCSPELFLSFSGVQADGHNQVITRPIKGTRPRSLDAKYDEIERKTLTHSEKDHSENLMIVDLLRHDLSQHAVIGSVQVPALFAVESFAQVHHLVSEIQATLRPDVSALDVLIDALPGGSITGAPKKRAMEIIAELEAMPRGAYCGSFGYLNHDGSGQFNILIRTLQKYQDNLIAWAGGGITIASNVEDEYQECFDKISAILNCVNEFQN